MVESLAPRTAASGDGYRPVRLGSSPVAFDRRADGTIRVKAVEKLPEYPARLTDRLFYWAEATPGRTLIARRVDGGDWRRITYAEALASARSIAQALLDRRLGPDRPVAILSGNSLDHFLLGLGCLVAGIPYAPISPAYSTATSDFGKLRHILDLLTPGLVFADDGSTYGPAIAATMPASAELVVSRNPPPGLPATSFMALVETPAGPAVDAAHAAVGPDTIAKFLFTSGSTGLPKGVINTQRMLCANQVMLRTSLAFFQDEPPVLVDWLPWNHTFGGNHNIGLVLFNGGSLYIDDGRPTPGGIVESVRNLREIPTTFYANVPRGFEELLPHLRADDGLRRMFFSHLQLLFPGGAGISKEVWDQFDELALETIGERIVLLTGLGATETAPFALVCRREYCRAGYVGLPVRGVELKLAPVDGKMEARLKGPTVTPGYWRQPELTRAAFDEEGFYKFGDALAFIDPDDPHKGFAFDGRITEDFKLSTGTWVSVGPLRAKFLSHFSPLVADVVFAGINRNFLGALVFPEVAACSRLAPDAASLPALVAEARVRMEFAARLASFVAANASSSTRVERILLLDDPPSLDAGEITDKRSINQRAVLARRAPLVEELLATPPSSRVILP